MCVIHTQLCFCLCSFFSRLFSFKLIFTAKKNQRKQNDEENKRTSTIGGLFRAFTSYLCLTTYKIHTVEFMFHDVGSLVLLMRIVFHFLKLKSVFAQMMKQQNNNRKKKTTLWIFIESKQHHRNSYALSVAAKWKSATVIYKKFNYTHAPLEFRLNYRQVEI